MVEHKYGSLESLLILEPKNEMINRLFQNINGVIFQRVIWEFLENMLGNNEFISYYIYTLFIRISHYSGDLSLEQNKLFKIGRYIYF